VLAPLGDELLERLLAAERLTLAAGTVLPRVDGDLQPIEDGDRVRLSKQIDGLSGPLRQAPSDALALAEAIARAFDGAPQDDGEFT